MLYGARRSVCRRILPAANAFRPAHRLPLNSQLASSLQQLTTLNVDFSVIHVLSVNMSSRESAPRSRSSRVLRIFLIAAAVSVAGFLLLIGLTSMFPSLKPVFGIGYINGLAGLVLVTAIALIKALFKK
jgi:hypothetical protein